MFGLARTLQKQKSGRSAHSFLFGSSCEPVEDGADIGPEEQKSKLFPRSLAHFLMKSELRQHTLAGPETVPGMEKNKSPYHGWWVVFCCFVIALYGWGFGFYGLSLYLVALQKAHGWSPATISAVVTFYYIAGSFLVMQVGDLIQKRGGRPVVVVGAALMSLGVCAITLVADPWRVFL